MDGSINRDALTNYIDSLTDKLLFNFFNTHDFATGDNIKHFTSVQQVNLFIIQELFSKWQAETEQLRSPYFDFEADEVKDALNVFMKQLSFHIKIDSKSFKPLLKTAIQNCLELIISPFNYLKSSCLHFEEVIISKQSIEQRTKYININKFIITEALVACQHTETIATEDFINECSKIYIQKSSQLYQINTFIKEFASYIPEDIINTIVNASSATKESIEVTNHKTEKVKETIKENSSITKEEEVKTINNSVEQVETLASKLEKQKIDHILSSLSINERFSYINTLFDGNKDDFDEAFERLESMQSTVEAKQYLNDRFGRLYNWEEKEETTERLFGLLERRY